MKMTIEDLLIDAIERMDRARKILSKKPYDWQLLNTSTIRLRLNAIDARFSSINKAKGATPSSAHIYTEGSEIEPKVKAHFVPCNYCDESGCTFNCIGKRKNAVGPAVHPYPETLQSKLDDLSKAWKTFIAECKEAVYPSTLTMEQKVAAARELWEEFLDDPQNTAFEIWLNKKNGAL